MIPTRADDEAVLEALHLREARGMTLAEVSARAGKGPTWANETFRRIFAALERSERDPAHGPAATRPENMNGGMGPLWWRA